MPLLPHARHSPMQVNFTSTEGGTATVPGITEINLPAGTFDDGSTTPAAVTLTPVSEVVAPTLGVAAARYDIASTATKVVTIFATQQPKQRVQVSSYTGCILVGHNRNAGDMQERAGKCRPTSKQTQLCSTLLQRSQSEAHSPPNIPLAAPCLPCAHQSGQAAARRCQPVCCHPGSL